MPIRPRMTPSLAPCGPLVSRAPPRRMLTDLSLLEGSRSCGCFLMLAVQEVMYAFGQGAGLPEMGARLQRRAWKRGR